ncbi:MAG: AAA family ATPase [Gallionella sp.]
MLGPRQVGKTTLALEIGKRHNALYLDLESEQDRSKLAQPELYLSVSWPDGSLWAIEIKRSLAPKLERRFHAACADLVPARKFVVYPGTERYRLAADIEAIPLEDMASELVIATGDNPWCRRRTTAPVMNTMAQSL